MLKKFLVCAIVVLFIGMSVVPSSGITIKNSVSLETNKENDGTLSGYVNDTSGNPIDGALVRVHFHGTYEEDYSDSTGYYHVTNIPICYCMKNATCSKEGYETEWVLLSIVEDTTYDFVLTSNSNPLEVEVTWETYKVDGQWYVTFTCDSSDDMKDIDRVEFYIDDGLMAVIDGSGPVWAFTMEWTEAMESCIFKFVFYGLEGDTAEVIIDGSDVAPLDVEVTWEVYKEDGQWYVTFTCESAESIDRIEVFINDELMETMAGPGPFGFTIEWTKSITTSTFKFVFYSLGEETSTVIIKGSDIKSASYSHQFINSIFLQIFQRLMNINKNNTTYSTLQNQHS